MLLVLVSHSIDSEVGAGFFSQEKSMYCGITSTIDLFFFSVIYNS